jgi:hypothetical protein
MTRRTHGEADSGVTNMDPMAYPMAKTKWVIPRIRHRNIAGPSEGLTSEALRLGRT